MRTRATNFLQIIVLITGSVYLFIGIWYFISPLSMLELFSENFPKEWFNQIENDEILAQMFYISRTFAAILFTSGFSMILPLFDPLKYRGLIYYNGVLFPFIASVLTLKNGLFYIWTSKNIVSQVVKFDANASIAWHQGRLLIIVVGIVFAVIFILNILTLLYTKKQTKSGIE